jgi:hypothetical protein
VDDHVDDRDRDHDDVKTGKATGNSRCACS